MFDELNEEGASPRGKTTLVQALFENRIDPSRKTKQFISECLLCSACVQVCPNGVQTDLLVLSARKKLAEKPGLNFTEIGLTKLGFSKTEVSFKLVSLLEKAVGDKIMSDSGIFYRLPLNRILPGIKEGAFSRSKKNTSRAGTNTGLYLGCLIDFIYHDIARDAVELMHASGIKPYIPGQQGCCGLPAFSMGDTDRAVKQAGAVMSLFGDVDTVVTVCASCGSMLKNYYPLLFQDTTDSQRAMAFSKKVRDITEVVDISGIKGTAKDHTPVTYHDPCHLKRGMALSEKPRMLIKKAGYRIVEMKEPDRCCGLGGTFTIKHHNISSAVTKKKIQDISATGALTVATGCPGCMANIAGMMIEEGVNVKVVHTVNLLATALSPKNAD